MPDRNAANNILTGVGVAFDAIWGTAFAIAEASPGGRVSRPAIQAVIFATHNVPLGAAKGAVTQDWNGAAIDLATGVVVGAAASAMTPVVLGMIGVVAAPPIVVGVVGAGLAWGVGLAVQGALDWANSPEGQAAFDTVEEAFMSKLAETMTTLGDGASDIGNWAGDLLDTAMTGVDGLAVGADLAAANLANAMGQAIGSLANEWATAIQAADGAVEGLGQALLDGLANSKTALDEKWSGLAAAAEDFSEALGSGGDALAEALADLGAAAGPLFGASGPLADLANALGAPAGALGNLLASLFGADGPLGPNGPQAGHALPWSELAKAFTHPPISPLVLDLDGNGLDLVDLDASQAHFDLNQNGLAEHTAWIGPNDAFLAMDRNSDGTINNLSELFGGEEIDGFTTLAASDLNHDHVIDSSDAIYANLLLWKDLDGDGATDTGELQNLSAAGVTSIALNADFINQWVDGNWISHRSAYTSSSGDRPIYDVWFENDQVDTVNNSVGAGSVAADALNLPYLPGYGEVADLYTAMTADADLLGDLQDLVLAAAGMSASALKVAVEGFLVDWVGVEDVSATSRGAYVNGKHLAFLEKIHGVDFVAVGNTSNPGPNASTALEDYYNAIVTTFTADLLSQFATSNLLLTRNIDAIEEYDLNKFSGITSNLPLDGSGLALAEDRFIHVARGISAEFGFDTDEGPSQTNFAEGFRQLELLKVFGQALEFNKAQFNEAFTGFLAAAEFDVGWQATINRLWDASPLWGTTGNDTLTATGATATRPLFGDLGDDQLNGTGQADILVGGRGNDVLSGGNGGDAYIFRSGDGADSINDISQSGIDKILLGTGLGPQNLTITRSGTLLVDAKLDFGNGDYLNIKDQFKNPIIFRGIEVIQFDNGAAWSLADLRDAYVVQNQTTGNDTINGFENASTYLFTTLAGNDTLIENGEALYSDRLIFGSGLIASNLLITRSTIDLEDVTLSFGGGSLTLDEQFRDPNSRFGVEQVEFGDGTLWSATDLRNAYVAQAQTAGHDTIIGFVGADIFLFTALAGNDILTENADANSSDRLVFGSGLAPTTLVITRSTTDLEDVTLSFGGGGSLTLDEQFGSPSSRYGVEQIQFGDGTLWSAADLRNAYVAQAQTPDNDAIYGFVGADTYLFALLAGNDSLAEGMDILSNDRLVFGSGLNASNLVITRSTTDLDDITLSFGGGSSLTLDEQFQDPYGRYGVEQIQFDNGTLWSATDLRQAYVAQAQTAGNDTIKGFIGADTFIFAALAGDDLLTEGLDILYSDRLVFGSGLNPSNLVITRSTTDLDDATLSFGGGDSLTLDEQFGGVSSSHYGTEQIQFGDGTLWSVADLRNAYIEKAQTASDDTIYGFSGATTYVFMALAGDDILIEDADLLASDRLVFGSGLNPSNVVVTRSTTDIDDVTLSFGGGGSLTLDEQFREPNIRFGVEQIQFGDGTLWSTTDLRSAYLAQAQTAGNDIIIGFGGADVLSGGDGDDDIKGLGAGDIMTGGTGADVLTGGNLDADRFIYNSVSESPASAGWDRITDFAGSDRIDLSAIDANTAIDGDQAFIWLGAAVFTNQPGQLRYQQIITGARSILGDIDGDGLADIRVDLSGSGTPTAAYFIL